MIRPTGTVEFYNGRMAGRKQKGDARMNDASKRRELPCNKDAQELLEMYYLEIRSHLLEAAAGIDRIAAAAGGDDAMQDPRMTRVMESLDLLREPGTDRAPRFLELFSDLS